MGNQHLIKRIGRYELYVEVLDFGEVEYMFYVNYYGESVNDNKSSVIGSYDSKSTLLKNINDFLKRYTVDGVFEPFVGLRGIVE